MAADFIKISRDQSAATESAELLNYIRTLRTAYELGIRIRAKMGHNFEGNANAELIDWAQLETLWGVPAGQTSVGTGANGKRIYTYIDGSVGGMEGQFESSAGRSTLGTDRQRRRVLRPGRRRA